MKKQISALLIACSALMAVQCTTNTKSNQPTRVNPTITERVEDDPIYNYANSGDQNGYWIEWDINSSGNYTTLYDVFQGSRMHFNFDTLVLNTYTLTPSKFSYWDSKLSSYSPTLAISGNTLSAVGGNSVTIPFYTAGSGISITSGIISNTSPNQAVSLYGINGATVTGTYPTFTVNAPAASTFTVNGPSSAATHTTQNTAYQPSTTKATRVSLSAAISCSLTLGGIQSGTITLQYSPDGTNWTTYSRIQNANAGTLVVGINMVQTSGSQMSVDLPKGWYWKWVQSGTGSFGVTDVFETPIN